MISDKNLAYFEQSPVSLKKLHKHQCFNEFEKSQVGESILVSEEQKVPIEEQEEEKVPE